MMNGLTAEYCNLRNKYGKGWKKMRNNKDRVLKIVEYISALTLILIIFDCKNVLSQFIRINNDNVIN